jgi:hypothetical protein
MKKMILMAVAAMMATMSVNAQVEDLKNEVSVSYGLGLSLIGDGLGNGVGRGIIDSGLGYEYANNKQFGTLAVEYFRHLNNPRLAVGAVMTYARYGEDLVKKNGGQKDGERTRNYFAVMPAIKYYWVYREHFGLYSKAALGLMMMFENEKQNGKSMDDNTNPYFMCQISPIGLEAGGRAVRGFVEAGVGEQGILLAGLRVKF